MLLSELNKKLVADESVQIYIGCSGYGLGLKGGDLK
jgi:hypothetical protein